MTANKEKLFEQFPPVSTEEWKEKVIADLKGADFDKKLVWRTNEGFNVQPMYRAEDIEGLKTTDSLPGEYPYVRGTKRDNEWLIRQDIHVENPQEANQKALDLLQKGVTSLGFQIGQDHINPEGFATLLKGIDAENVELNFISCIKNAVKVGTELTAYFKAQGVDLQKVKGSISYGPFKRILKHGRDFPKYADMAVQAIESVSELPHYRVLMVDAVMLSGETASGEFPLEAVETMTRVICEIEQDEEHFTPLVEINMVSVNHEITAQLARSAVKACLNLPIKAVITETLSGRTGRYLAAFRGQKPVYAVCYKARVMRQLALSYGIQPLKRDRSADRSLLLSETLEHIESESLLKPDDLIIVVGGGFDARTGATYLEIGSVEQMKSRNRLPAIG